MEGNTEIDVLKLLHRLLKNIHWIAASAVVCGLLMFLYTSFFSAPMYRSEAVVYISNKVSYDSNRNTANTVDLDASIQLVPVYSSLIKTNAVLERVAEASRLPYSAGQIARLIGTQTIDDTAVLRIYAVSPEPEHCAILARAVATTGISEITKIAPGSSAYIIDEPEIPTAPYAPSMPKRVFLGFFAGAALAAAVVVIRELLDTKISTEEEFASIIEAPVLGVVGRQQLAD